MKGHHAFVMLWRRFCVKTVLTQETICKIWREKNNDKLKVLELDSTEWRRAVMTHVSNLFAALFRSERARLYGK